MHLILLSGGGGQRLWPLSGDIRSKQFLRLFPGEGGEAESMVQRVFRQIRRVLPEAGVTIATSGAQASLLREQLGEQADICVEPCRRDTFPAIALATAYLHDVQGVREEEAVVVCPVDPYVNDDYFQALQEMGRLAQAGESHLTLMGIEPTCPSEKYGYIIPENEDRVSRAAAFREKPDQERAREYIAKGALWNGGVFAFRSGWLLETAREITGFRCYADLYENYGSLKKISFDYAVAEKETNIRVLRFAGEWRDVGSWNTLTEVLPEPCVGEKIRSVDCENVHIFNELGIPLLCMGLTDAVVVASPEGILISDRAHAEQIRSYVETIAGKAAPVRRNI